MAQIKRTSICGKSKGGEEQENKNAPFSHMVGTRVFLYLYFFFFLNFTISLHSPELQEIQHSFPFRFVIYNVYTFMYTNLGGNKIIMTPY